MAVRGINPIEKHIEKIFLGLAAAGLTGVVAWQFAGGAGTVDVAPEKGVPAEQAYGKLEAKAKSLLDKMNDTSPRTPDALRASSDPRAMFRARLTGDVAPAKTLAYRPAGVSFGKSSDSGPMLDQFFLPPTLPPGAKPIAHAFMSTVHDGDVTAYQGLAAYMAAAAPYDKAAVSVETTIDPRAIREALERDPDAAGPAQPLLRAWWATTEVVAVELVRQELLPDGTWGKEQASSALPGRRNYNEQLKDPQIDSRTLAEIAADAGLNMEEVIRPQWYRRAELAGGSVGEEWKRPSEAARSDVAGDAGPATEINRRLREQRQALQQAERALERVRQQPAPGTGGGGRSGGGAIGTGGGGRSPAPSGGGSGNQPPRTDPREEQIRGLERRIEQTKRLIADLEGQLTALGAKADSAPAASITRDADLGLLLSATQPITIWSHDLQARRGATYRYQLRAKLSNPLFNRGGQLKAENVEASKATTLTVPCADWSDPVRVDEEVYCFITGAGAGNNAIAGSGLGNAQAMMFYYTWGYWRSDTISLEPGDGMVATWTVPDESKITSAPGAAPEQAPMAPVPGGGGRRPVAPAAPGGITDSTGNAPPGGAAAPSTASLPTRQLSKERDSFLLDVVQNPLSRGNERSSFLALIRDIDRTIVAKDPSAERASPLFRRLEASARAGLDQLRGVTAAPAGQPGATPPPSQIPPLGQPPAMNPAGG